MTSQTLFEQIVFSECVKITFSQKQTKSQTTEKITIVPKLIQQQPRYQFTFYVENKVLHKNVAPSELWLEIESFIPLFKQCLVKLTTKEYHIFFNKKGEKILEKKSENQPISLEHNASRNYIINEGKPVPFFQALKVMDSQGKVFPTKYNKFRQINRYLEFIRDLLDVFPIDKPLKVVDFGCGKSYLTFAAYHYLHDMIGYQVTMVGLDLKKDVIDFCNQVAKTCYMDDLSFEVGDIGSYQQLSNVDLVFSLHACDTATDLAIAKAVESEAKVILAVPCCQHELFDQIKSQSNPFLLEQGIVKERIAALLTDVARHELLGAVGYKSQIIEFIETEHTPKNLLIRAIKGEVDRQTHHSNFLALKQEYGFEHTLETLLKPYL